MNGTVFTNTDFVGFSFENDMLEEVLQATKEKRFLPGPYFGRRLIFVSKKNPPENFKSKFRELQRYIRAHFGVRMLVGGGGFGCIKHEVIFLDSELGERVIAAIKANDPGLLKRLNSCNFDYAIDPKTHNQIFIGVGGTEGSERQSQIRLKSLKQQLSDYVLTHAQDLVNVLQDFLKAVDTFVDAILGGLRDASAQNRMLHLADLISKKAKQAKVILECIMGTIDMIAAPYLMAA